MNSTAFQTRHQRFFVQGWMRHLKGLQADLGDRFVASTEGALCEDEAQALIVDAEGDPELVENMRALYDRQFYSPQLRRWV